jgi:hypothetical protein
MTRVRPRTAIFNNLCNIKILLELKALARLIAAFTLW